MNAEFNYHRLRHALNDYGKGLAQLDEAEHEHAQRKAERSFALESRVLASAEAGCVVIPAAQLEQAVGQVAARYEGHADFIRDLQANGLDEDGLRRALYRELLFDAVMQRVAAGVTVSEIDVRLFHELHPEKFITPEKRAVSHILITVNPDYPENTASAARRRIEKIARELSGSGRDFAACAQRYSECPSAMQGGQLGQVTRGQLYPQLDRVLFAMRAHEISPVVESELGLHLLYCETITPERCLSLADAAPQIRELLRQRQARACQKAWLKQLSTGEHNNV